MIQDSLGYLLAAATRLATKEFNKTLKQYGITAPQWSVLNFLHEQGSFPQTQIGEQLHWEKATIGDIVENLVKKGLADRRISEQDRRAYSVSITPAGAELIRQIGNTESEINARACAGMEEWERDFLKELLHHTIRNLDENRKGGAWNKHPQC